MKAYGIIVGVVFTLACLFLLIASSIAGDFGGTLLPAMGLVIVCAKIQVWEDAKRIQRGETFSRWVFTKRIGLRKVHYN